MPASGFNAVLCTVQVGCIIKNADLLVPALQGGLDYDLNALASLIRDWSNESLLSCHALATFLLTENLNDLHPLIVNNPRIARIRIDLPSSDQLLDGFRIMAPSFPVSLTDMAADLPAVAEQFADTTLSALESTIKTKEHRKERLVAADLARLKKDLVEKDTSGLIEFIETPRTLNDLYGLDKIKSWLRQDIELWKKMTPRRSPRAISSVVPWEPEKPFSSNASPEKPMFPSSR